jgi:hypothetical protein
LRLQGPFPGRQSICWVSANYVADFLSRFDNYFNLLEFLFSRAPLEDIPGKAASPVQGASLTPLGVWNRRNRQPIDFIGKIRLFGTGGRLNRRKRKKLNEING